MTMAFLRLGIAMALLAMSGVAVAHGFVFFINTLFANPDREHVVCFYDHHKGEKLFLQSDLRIKLDESVYWGSFNSGLYDSRQEYAELVESKGVNLDEVLTTNQEIGSCLLDVNEKRVLEGVSLTESWPGKAKY